MALKTMTEEELANLSDAEIMGMAMPPVMTASEETAQDLEDPLQETEEDELVAEPEAEGTGSDPDPAAGESEGEDDDPDDDPQKVDPSLEMSDEDFMKLKEPPAPKAKKEPAGEAEKPKAEEALEVPGSTPKGKVKPVPKPADKAAEKPGKETPADPNAPVKPAAEPMVEPDYKALYERIMGPIKASGKEIKLQSPDDAIRLMQMGADYTKKLQALAPNLKMMKMLENKGLLKEDQLTFLIDLAEKNPAAIAKLVKDSGVDPMDIDTSEDPGYKPGNHTVSDAEMRFTGTVEEVALDPAGKEIITVIHKSWDKQSKDQLWQDPEILRVLTEHRKSGIYGQISDEVERQKTLGYLRDVPALDAYQRVGKAMDAKGLLKPKTQAAPAKTITPAPAPAPAARPAAPIVPAAEKKVLDQRTGIRQTTQPLANAEQARAMSPMKTIAPKKAATPADFNPLSMSDEEFTRTQLLAKRL